jgi:hypothetical protein
VKSWGCFAGLAIVAMLIAAGIYFQVRIGPTFSVCRTDDEMSQAEQAEIATPAIAVVRGMRSGETDAIYQMMSAEARAATAPDALAQASRAAGEPNLTGEITTRHVFRIFSVGSSSGKAMCSTPSGNAFLARGGGMLTAYAQVIEPVNGAERSWIVWLERENDAWRIRAFHMAVSAIDDHSGEEFWRIAREQSARGHSFNATILYDVAQSALNRGPNMQAPEADGFAAEREAFQRHADLPGQPPLTFRLGGKEFPIRWMTATGTGDNKLTLIIDREGAPVSEAEAPAFNRDLIDAMNQHRGEWREVFDAIAVGYPTGGNNRVWRTVYKADSGYLPERTPQN